MKKLLTILLILVTANVFGQLDKAFRSLYVDSLESRNQRYIFVTDTFYMPDGTLLFSGEYFPYVTITVGDFDSLQGRVIVVGTMTIGTVVIDSVTVDWLSADTADIAWADIDSLFAVYGDITVLYGDSLWQFNFGDIDNLVTDSMWGIGYADIGNLFADSLFGVYYVTVVNVYGDSLFDFDYADIDNIFTDSIMGTVFITVTNFHFTDAYGDSIYTVDLASDFIYTATIVGTLADFDYADIDSLNTLVGYIDSVFADYATVTGITFTWLDADYADIDSLVFIKLNGDSIFSIYVSVGDVAITNNLGATNALIGTAGITTLIATNVTITNANITGYIDIDSLNALVGYIDSVFSDYGIFTNLDVTAILTADSINARIIYADSIGDAINCISIIYFDSADGCSIQYFKSGIGSYGVTVTDGTGFMLNGNNFTKALSGDTLPSMEGLRSLGFIEKFYIDTGDAPNISVQDRDIVDWKALNENTLFSSMFIGVWNGNIIRPMDSATFIYLGEGAKQIWYGNGDNGYAITDTIGTTGQVLKAVGTGGYVDFRDDEVIGDTGYSIERGAWLRSGDTLDTEKQCAQLYGLGTPTSYFVTVSTFSTTQKVAISGMIDSNTTSGFVTTDSSISVNGSVAEGMYLSNCTGAFTTADGSQVKFVMTINDNEYDPIMNILCTIKKDTCQAVALTGLVYLSDGDIVKIAVQTPQSGGGSNIYLRNFNFNMIKLY